MHRLLAVIVMAWEEVFFMLMVKIRTSASFVHIIDKIAFHFSKIRKATAPLWIWLFQPGGRGS